MRRHERPEEWSWELELTPHVRERMRTRGFDEIDLRAMLEDASGWLRGPDGQRWVVSTRHERRWWEIIVEPDSPSRTLVVVTAYPVT